MQLTTYLLFDGTCKDAMNFYHDIFGGELPMTGIGESPMKAAFPEAMHGKSANARLSSDVLDMSASDWLRPAGKPIQGNTVMLYVSEGSRVPDGTARDRGANDCNRPGCRAAEAGQSSGRCVAKTDREVSLVLPR